MFCGTFVAWIYQIRAEPTKYLVDYDDKINPVSNNNTSSLE